ncbi:MAG: hypothetical protein PHI96_04905, partial [Desulfovibrio sp.]|nr:hypothetical protein [Desulfovibrio sp.]
DELLFVARWADRRFRQDTQAMSSVQSSAGILRDLARRFAQAATGAPAGRTGAAQPPASSGQMPASQPAPGAALIPAQIPAQIPPQGMAPSVPAVPHTGSALTPPAVRPETIGAPVQVGGQGR